MKHMIRMFALMVIVCTALSAAQAPKILPPEEAFKVSALHDTNGVKVSVVLGEGIYLYDDKLTLDIIKPSVISLDTLVERPKAENFHEYVVQRNSFELFIPQSLLREKVKSGAFTLKLSYQGCSELGLCYQPMDAQWTFNVEGNMKNDTALVSEQDNIARSLATGNIFIVLLSFFGFGLLLSLTPCVFPMIPILSSIIVSQSNTQMSARKGFLFALVYVLAMSFAYALAGVLAGLFGANLQAALQNPWVISTFSALFVLLAFSMFGFFEIQIPSFIQSKVSKTSDQMHSHGLLGIAIMGFLSALIVGPCVAAPLAGALIYIGQSGNALLGGSALFVMSLGMGVPLLIIGTTAGKYMPRPGGWMQNITTLFGFIMLGVAIWMLSRIIPSAIAMLFWSVLLITGAIYAGVLEPIKEGVSGWFKLFKSIAVMVLVYGVVLFVGFISGGSDPLNPLEKLISKEVSMKEKSSQFTYIKSRQELNEAVKSAQKIVMLDFYADWCVNCVEYEKFTFSDERVKAKMAQLELLKADVTQNNAEDKAMQTHFGIFGPPAILFFKNGIELKEYRLVGYKNADEFLSHLAKLGL